MICQLCLFNRGVDLTVRLDHAYSPRSIQRAMEINPHRSSTRRVLSSLQRIQWVLGRKAHGLLPPEFYNATAYGPTPKDPWLTVNARWQKDQCLSALADRNITVTFWVEGLTT